MLKKLQTKTNQTNGPTPTSSLGVSGSILPNKPLKDEFPPSPAPLASENLQTTAKEPKLTAENVRTDLKIKIANVNKTLLDLEMQNITGDLSDDDYNEKTRKLESVKSRLEDQLKEISNV